MESVYKTSNKSNVLGRSRPILRLTHPPSRSITPQTVHGKVFTLRGPQDYIPHPISKQPVFGYVPPVSFLEGAAQALPVVLTMGYQFDTGSGMGAAHAWANHRGDIKAIGGTNAEDTALLVARVIAEGTPLHYEEGSPCRPKLVAYRPGAGTVVLGLFRFGLHRRWQVITAHGGKGYLGDHIGEIAETQLLLHLC